MKSSPRIVLLHATPVAVEPVREAFAEIWPQAELVNLLDDSLSIDRSREHELSQPMVDRFLMLGRYAKQIGANGILVTCSAFGPAIEEMAAELPIPVLKPNEAMFEAALTAGNRIGMIATFPPSVATMEAEFRNYAAAARSSAILNTVLEPAAIEALRRGDGDRHNVLVAGRAAELSDCDAIMLAHFSTSRAAKAVQARVSTPVLTAPGAAVSRMRARIEGAPQI